MKVLSICIVTLIFSLCANGQETATSFNKTSQSVLAELDLDTLALNESGHRVLIFCNDELETADRKWHCEKQQNGEAMSLIRRNESGLIWITEIMKIKPNVWEVRHNLENTSNENISIGRLKSCHKNGEYSFSRVSKFHVDAITTSVTQDSFDVGRWNGYFILHDVNSLRELHVYMPQWLDDLASVNIGPGNRLFDINFYFDVSNDIGDPNIRVQKAPIDGGSWKQVGGWIPLNYNLKPSEKKNICYRVGIFKSNGQMRPKQGLLYDILGDYDYRCQRDSLLAMGVPLPKEPTRFPGHIMVMDWPDTKNDELLKWMASAGTGIVVLRTPDFRDIAHGVSWDGDYNSMPPDVHQVVNKIHSLGMKAVWWFSVRGVLDKGSDRNNQRADALLNDHADWFFPVASYWSDLYRYADMFSSGWKQWCLKKIQFDLKRIPELDGFAFDEPYFFGQLVEHEGDKIKTFARNGRDFLKEIHTTIKAKSSDKIIIANFWFPAADAYDFFDYTVQEGPGFPYLCGLTRGKSCAGRGIGEHFTWKRIVSHFSELYVTDPVGIGWVHPTWYMYLKPYKSPDSVARFMNLLGRGELVFGGQFSQGVSQIELKMGQSYYLLIANASNQSRAVKASLHVVLEPEKYDAKMTIDTSTDTLQRDFKYQGQNVIEMGEISSESIVMIEWMIKK